MDSVRFGRALGIGARSAAKALAGAVDAATSPDPRLAAPASMRQPTTQRAADPVAPVTARRAAVDGQRVWRAGGNLVSSGKRVAAPLLSPIRRLSGVLWLEMTGAFFGIFALFAAQAFWSHLSEVRSASLHPDARRNALVFLAMTLVFGYFCISSFVRARRRERSR